MFKGRILWKTHFLWFLNCQTANSQNEERKQVLQISLELLKYFLFLFLISDGLCSPPTGKTTLL